MAARAAWANAQGEKSKPLIAVKFALSNKRKGELEMPRRHRATYSSRFDKANRKFEETAHHMAGTPINVSDRDVETHLYGISEDEALRGAAGSDMYTEEPLETTGKTRTQGRKSKANKSGNSRTPGRSGGPSQRKER